VLKAASGEVVCSGVKGRSFELTLGSNSAELVHISYSGAEHRFDVAGHQVALEPTDEPRIHIFVDGSVIESVLSERVGYTSRFYYSAKSAPDITTSVKGEAKITAWKISPITCNRLTTPASYV
jgi:beta-fructofuranosidase